jgi:predicted Zn-dependent protease
VRWDLAGKYSLPIAWKRACPEEPKGWSLLSEAEEALGQPEAALEAAKKAAALHSEDGEFLERVKQLERRPTR